MNQLRRPGQAKRDPGPITMSANSCAELGPQLCLQQALVVMGPHFREDDVGEIAQSQKAVYPPSITKQSAV